MNGLADKVDAYRELKAFHHLEDDMPSFDLSPLTYWEMENVALSRKHNGDWFKMLITNRVYEVADRTLIMAKITICLLAASYVLMFVLMLPIRTWPYGAGLVAIVVLLFTGSSVYRHTSAILSASIKLAYLNMETGSPDSGYNL